MILAGLHCGTLAVQLSGGVNGRAEAELINKFADKLHAMTAKIDVVIAKIGLGVAVFEGKAPENFCVNHDLCF